MNRTKLIYYISTGLMCVIFLFSSALYVFGHDMAAQFYSVIGFPVWILYPSALIKVLGVIAILSRKSKLLLEWAYSGFFFDVVFATLAHLMAGDGQEPLSILALVVTVVSRIYHTKMFGRIVYSKTNS